LRGLRAGQILRALGRAGWYESSRSGSHVQLRNIDESGRKITVPFHAGRDIPVKTVLSILRQAGISAEEFEQLL
jgi:predicted RNA binding protein YcfA (HicA-like mRNA interferase family)